MLAARHRQNHLSAPLHSLCQGKIRGCVARMQGNHHVRPLCALISGDIPMAEPQILKPKLLPKAAAEINHILLQIQPRYPDRIPPNLFQIIIHGKRQIRLPAAKIHNRIRPLPRELRKNILNKLQKPVDLPELIILPLHHPAVPRHNSQIHQKRNRLAFPQNIIPAPVMTETGFFPAARSAPIFR